MLSSNDFRVSTAVFSATLAGALFLGAAVASAVEEVYVYHLLVRSKAQAEKALDEVVNAGGTRENFIRAARKYSMDHPTKGSGGDLGWNSRRKFVPEFADAAFDTQPGQVSEPVRTKYGWHLLYVKDKRDLTAATPQRPRPTQPAAEPGHEGHNHPPGEHGKAQAVEPGHEGHNHPPGEHGKPQPVAVEPGHEGHNHPPGQHGKTAAAEATKVAKEPKTAKPVARRLPDRQLRLTLESERPVVTSVAPLEVSITVENRGQETARVFAASLLPLGLSVRTDTTPATPPASFDAIADPEAFVVDLPSRGILGGSFALHDYFKDLPANCRLFISWDAKKFQDNFNSRFPDKAAVIDGYALAVKNFPTERSREFQILTKGLPSHNSWVFNRKKELPAAIFDSVRAQDKYFAKLTISNQQPLWFELFSEQQLPGVRQFVRLANEGFYDGLRFYNIQEGKFFQGGCPKNNGTGGPDRPAIMSNTAKLSHEKGVLSLATRMRASGTGREAGSIFFICRSDLKEYDDMHVPIGKLILGEGSLDAIEARKNSYVSIESVSIVTESRAPQSVLDAAGIEATAVASTTPADTTTTTPADASSDNVKIVARPALPQAVIETSRGYMTAELYEDDARNTVANFVSLVESGFFNADGNKSLKFFDIQPGYYVRTGSPDNSQTGGPGYTIASEVTNNTRTHEKGTLSMCLDVNSTTGQPILNTAGSQFFICTDDVSFWNGKYTPFGKVIEGLDVLSKLTKDDSVIAIRMKQKRTGSYTPRKN